jgi:hypothetical protein
LGVTNHRTIGVLFDLTMKTRSFFRSSTNSAAESAGRHVDRAGYGCPAKMNEFEGYSLPFLGMEIVADDSPGNRLV